MLRTVLLAGVMTIAVGAGPAQACEIVMGFSDGQEAHLIGPPGHDEGGYKDLYTEAAKRIGCSLKIVRSAKERIFAGIEDGSIDFHPAAGFSNARAEYMAWIPNGFQTADVGVSRPDFPDITDESQLVGHTLVIDPSSAEAELEQIGVKLYRSNSKLSFDRAVRLMDQHRGDFFITEMVELDHYLVNKGVDTAGAAGIKAHLDCCGGVGPMYLGFSRKSEHWVEQPNPAYDPAKELSETNLKVTSAADSVAHRFGTALKQIEAEGLAKKIYNRKS